MSADFLTVMARSDQHLEHTDETCGLCYRIHIDAQVARELLAANEQDDPINKWCVEAERRWQDSKFYKLWQDETNAGRDPQKAFTERGWEP